MASVSERLISLLKNKGVLNKDTTDATFRVFSKIKKLLIGFESALNTNSEIDSRLKVSYIDRGTFEAELKISDDVLIFIMHTNAFVFEHGHPVLKSGYVSLDPSRGTCGMISVYNFLSDSFKYDKKNDVGQLIARVFINKEEHFFVEGKRQLGILFNDYANTVSNEETLSSLIDSCIVYSMDVDVTVPPFDAMKEISVFEAMSYNLQSAISPGKKLGFKFQSEEDIES